MDIGSDVRYSVLKERSSASNITNWTILDDSFNNLQNPNLINLNIYNSNDSDNPQQQQQKLNNNNIDEELTRINPQNSNSKYPIVGGNVETTTKSLNLSYPPSEDSFHTITRMSDLDQNVIISRPSNQLFKFLKQKRTNLEKILSLIVILLLLLFLLLCLSIVLNKNNFNDRRKSEEENSNNLTKHCLSDQCILLSSSIFKSLDMKVDPCDDFYEYSCGSWLKKNLIPTGYPRWGTLSLITYHNQLLIRELLESSNANASNLSEAEKKAITFYKSCIDPNDAIEKIGAKPLMNILDSFMYKNSNSNLVINETFSDILTNLQVEYGLNVLFEFTVLDDDKNSSFRNIEIIQGSLPLERSFYLNQSSEKNVKTLEVYKKTMINVFELLYGKVDNITEEIDNLIEFETELAKIFLPTERLGNVEAIYASIKLKDLNEMHAPFYNWTEFINRMLKRYESSEVLGGEDQIIVLGLEYFQNLTSLIQDYQKTARKEKTLRFFLACSLIRYALPFLTKDLRSQFISLGEVLTGIKGINNVERWQTCIEHTDNIFGLGYAISKMFIRITPNNHKTSAQNIIKSIKKSFVENFQHIAWMDNETRLLAEEKVNNVDELIGYPDFVDDDDKVNLRYKDLMIKDEDYFGNEIRLTQYALKSEVQTYRKRVNRVEWEMTSSAVNAYYSPTRNQIVFPSGILQEPFFHPDYPMSLNYGSIGSIMGHELTHGFDNSGREYDKDGMMHQWWNNKTIADFEKASQCIVDQYSKYNMEGENINGKQTLSENIADNGGLRATYNAYENWVKLHGEEKPLPVLNLTHRQLLFVAFAQTWCTKSTKDSTQLSLSMDQHSPPRYRVIGSVSNSADFAKAFNCPVNSRMNPEKKCDLL